LRTPGQRPRAGRCHEAPDSGNLSPQLGKSCAAWPAAAGKRAASTAGPDAARVAVKDSAGIAARPREFRARHRAFSPILAYRSEVEAGTRCGSAIPAAAALEAFMPGRWRAGPTWPGPAGSQPGAACRRRPLPRRSTGLASDHLQRCRLVRSWPGLPGVRESGCAASAAAAMPGQLRLALSRVDEMGMTAFRGPGPGRAARYRRAGRRAASGPRRCSSAQEAQIARLAAER